MQLPHIDLINNQQNFFFGINLIMECELSQVFEKITCSYSMYSYSRTITIRTRRTVIFITYILKFKIMTGHLFEILLKLGD